MAVLAACSREAAAFASNDMAISAAATPAASAAPQTDYTPLDGRERRFVDVMPGATAGSYRLTMQYDLDYHGSIDAARDGATIAFERDGKRQLLKPTGGEATGLKYLAGNRDA